VPGLRPLARVVSVLVALATLALCIAFRIDDATLWWVELLRFVPFPAYLVPALVVGGLSLRLGRAWQCLALLTIAAVVVELMGLSWGSGDTGTDRLRVMTYNVKAHRADASNGGFARIATEILEHDPDIVVMQDAGSMVAADGSLPDALRMVLRDRRHYASGEYIVASRWPLRDCREGQIPYRKMPHAYVRCTVVVAGKELDIATVHFVSPRQGLNAARHEQLEGLADWRQNYADRLTQAATLASALSGNQRPLVLAGDLNAAEHSPVVRALLRTGLRDAFSSAGVGYGYTHGHALKLGFSFLRIDHILVSEGLGILDCFVGGSQASEHRPVIADLSLSRQ
jgi:vancomycin resistance protein VanJ